MEQIVKVAMELDTRHAKDVWALDNFVAIADPN
jgi:hypothetical protein